MPPKATQVMGPLPKSHEDVAAQALASSSSVGARAADVMISLLCPLQADAAAAADVAADHLPGAAASVQPPILTYPPPCIFNGLHEVSPLLLVGSVCTVGVSASMAGTCIGVRDATAIGVPSASRLGFHVSSLLTLC